MTVVLVELAIGAVAIEVVLELSVLLGEIGAVVRVRGAAIERAAARPAIGGLRVFRRLYNSGAKFITEAWLDTSKPYPRRGEEPPIVDIYEQTERTLALAHETMRRGFPPT
jgi:hypothetical protein